MKKILQRNAVSIQSSKLVEHKPQTPGSHLCHHMEKSKNGSQEGRKLSGNLEKEKFITTFFGRHDFIQN